MCEIYFPPPKKELGEKKMAGGKIFFLKLIQLGEKKGGYRNTKLLFWVDKLTTKLFFCVDGLITKLFFWVDGLIPKLFFWVDGLIPKLFWVDGLIPKLFW